MVTPILESYLGDGWGALTETPFHSDSGMFPYHALSLAYEAIGVICAPYH